MTQSCDSGILPRMEPADTQTLNDPFVLLTGEALKALHSGRVLEVIRTVTALRSYANDVTHEHVLRARWAGYSWEQIATALGTSRQSAWQRFSDVDESIPPGTRYIDGTHGSFETRSSETDDFLHADEIWSTLLRYLPRGRWIDLNAIYTTVAAHCSLTAADYEPAAQGSTASRWQRNVRNVLQSRKACGDIEWNGEAGYRLAG